MNIDLANQFAIVNPNYVPPKIEVEEKDVLEGIEEEE